MPASNAALIPTLITLAVSTVLNTMYFARTILRIYTENPERKKFGTVRVKDQLAYVVSSAVFMLVNITFGVLAKPVIDLFAEGIARF